MRYDPEKGFITVECFDTDWVNYGMCGGPGMSYDQIRAYNARARLDLGELPVRFAGQRVMDVDWSKTRGIEGRGVTLPSTGEWVQFLLHAATESEEESHRRMLNSHPQSESFACAERRTIIIHRARKVLSTVVENLVDK